MMTNQKFDLIVALHALCSEYHHGRGSRGYRILSRIETRYSPMNLPSRAQLVMDKRAGVNEWSDCYYKYNELKVKYRDKL